MTEPVNIHGQGKGSVQILCGPLKVGGEGIGVYVYHCPPPNLPPFHVYLWLNYERKRKQIIVRQTYLSMTQQSNLEKNKSKIILFPKENHFLKKYNHFARKILLLGLAFLRPPLFGNISIQFFSFGQKIENFVFFFTFSYLFYFRLSASIVPIWRSFQAFTVPMMAPFQFCDLWNFKFKHLNKFNLYLGVDTGNKYSPAPADWKNQRV